jgi:hypothetical protein
MEQTFTNELKIGGIPNIEKSCDKHMSESRMGETSNIEKSCDMCKRVLCNKINFCIVCGIENLRVRSINKDDYYASELENRKYGDYFCLDTVRSPPDDIYEAILSAKFDFNPKTLECDIVISIIVDIICYTFYQDESDYQIVSLEHSFNGSCTFPDLKSCADYLENVDTTTLIWKKFEQVQDLWLNPNKKTLPLRFVEKLSELVKNIRDIDNKLKINNCNDVK